jgi:hypothetical protein
MLRLIYNSDKPDLCYHTTCSSEGKCYVMGQGGELRKWRILRIEFGKRVEI